MGAVGPRTSGFTPYAARSGSLILARMNPVKPLLVSLSAVALALAVTGCDRTVSKSESTTVRSDGSVKSKETTVTQKADGSVVKTEETKKTAPAKP